jgi:hypothetical protein
MKNISKIFMVVMAFLVVAGFVVGAVPTYTKLSSTGYSFFNTDVGIGTDTPTAELDVVGDVVISNDLTVDTNTLFVDASTNRVGIGTVSPSAKLEVSTDLTTTAGYFEAYGGSVKTTIARPLADGLSNWFYRNRNST